MYIVLINNFFMVNCLWKTVFNSNLHIAEVGLAVKVW